MVITHLIPAGIIAPGVYNLILADVMVNPLEAVEEIKALQGMGYKVGPPNLGISSRVQMTLQYHLDFEADSEKKKGSNAVGTTMKGIGPTAVSKYGREGIRLAEFLDPGSFERFLGGCCRGGSSQKIYGDVRVCNGISATFYG
jgi:adenylosuccinate synthase